MEPNERVESIGRTFQPYHISNLEVVYVKGDGVVCEGRWGTWCVKGDGVVCVKGDGMVWEGRWDGV